jgi:hypothetical protein
MTVLPPESVKRLDLRTIIEVHLRQFVPWLAMVILVTWAGYPGVICVTPMSWLIALRVGNICVARSMSEQPSRRLLEAALAGGFLGFLQGVLFIVDIQFLGPIQADEWTRTIILMSILLVVGIIAGAVLSFFTASLNEQRKNRAKSSIN